MTSEQSDNLVARLEVFALQNPGGYRMRVELLAALGYAFVRKC